LKALEKDRDRRYASAAALGADVQRFLADEPVEAGPPSRAYRLRKFVRRNRGLVAGTAAVLVSLAGGAALATAEWMRAERERDQKETARRDAQIAAEGERVAAKAANDQRVQAEEVAGLMESVFRGVDPYQARDDLRGELLGRLTDASARLDSGFAGTPASKSRLQTALGNTAIALWEGELATRAFQAAHAEQTVRLGPGHRETLVSLNKLALAHQVSGRAREAVRLLEECLEKRRAALGPDDLDTLDTLHDLAGAYRAAGREKDAVPAAEKYLDGVKAIHGPDDRKTLEAMSDLAASYQGVGRLPEAVALYEACLKRRAVAHGRDHPLSLITANNLATAFLGVGQAADAVRLLEEYLPKLQARFGPDHQYTLRCRSTLASGYRLTGRPELAVAHHQELLLVRRAKLGPDDPDTLQSMNNLAVALQASGRPAEAIPHHEVCLKGRRATLPPRHRLIAQGVTELVAAYRSAGRQTDAISILRGYVADLRKSVPAEAPEIVPHVVGLFEVQLEAAAFPDAEGTLAEWLRVWQKAYPKGWFTYYEAHKLGEARHRQGRTADAEGLLVRGAEGMLAGVPAMHRGRVHQALGTVVQFYADTGRPAEAARLRARATRLPAEQAPRPRPSG
jgi:tetratricopeptide (TPR) repeat protein